MIIVPRLWDGAAMTMISDVRRSVPQLERPSPPSDAQFVAHARGLVKDLFHPRPIIYWLDFLPTISIADSSFYFAGAASRIPLPGRVGLFIISGLTFYRAALFIHELVHIPSQTLRRLRVVWNLSCGVPLLIPTFFYYTHLDHHRPKHYATADDGEYLPLARGRAIGLAVFVLTGMAVPAIAVIRFLVLTPLSWICPPLRRFIYRYASAMVIDPTYARPEPAERDRMVLRVQEGLCFIYLAALTMLFASRTIGLRWLGLGYAIGVFILTINSVRTLVAHRYRFAKSERHSLIEQFLDSINHPRWPVLTEIWVPVGLRFHALHHLLPGLPYHALPEAHQRLVKNLPSDSIYHQASSQGILCSLRQILKDISSTPAS